MATGIRRGIIAEDINRGFGPTTIQTDSGGFRVASMVGIHTFLGNAYLSAADFEGEDGGAQAKAAFDALPTSGGTVDLSGLYGTQAWTTNPFSGLTKPVTVIKGHDSTAFPSDWHNNNANIIDFSGTAVTIGNLSNIHAKVLFDSWNDGDNFNNMFNAAFQIHATDGGTVNIIDDVAVGLFAASERTGGFRPIWAGNFLTQIASGARTNISYGLEVDINNNDSDVSIGPNNEDQIGAYIAYGGGAYKALFGYRTRSVTAANRWRYAAWFMDWSDIGVRIDQSNISPAVTGPALYMVPSSNGTNALLGTRNASDTSYTWLVQQNGTMQFANDVHLQFINLAGDGAASIFQGSDDALHIRTSSANSLNLETSSGNAAISIGASTIAFLNNVGLTFADSGGTQRNGILPGSDNNMYYYAGNSGNGVLRIQNGTNIAIWSSAGLSMQSGAFIAKVSTFAALPGTPQQGMIAVVNNSNTSTHGATIAGGGSSVVVALYDGSNWVVV